MPSKARYDWMKGYRTFIVYPCFGIQAVLVLLLIVSFGGAAIAEGDFGSASVLWNKVDTINSGTQFLTVWGSIIAGWIGLYWSVRRSCKMEIFFWELVVSYYPLLQFVKLVALNYAFVYMIIVIAYFCVLFMWHRQIKRYYVTRWRRPWR